MVLFMSCLLDSDMFLAIGLLYAAFGGTVQI